MILKSLVLKTLSVPSHTSHRKQLVSWQNQVFGVFLILFCVPFLISYAWASGQIVALQNSNSVIVATESGQLQKWDKGAKLPRWSVTMGGERSSTNSPIALLQELTDGRILIVERYGRVLLMHSDDPKASIAKMPVMAWIGLKVKISEFDGKKLSEQAMLDRVGAAGLDSQGRLFLTSTYNPSVFRVDLLKFLNEPNEFVSIADHWYMIDKNNIHSVLIPRPEVTYAHEFVLPTAERSQITAVAPCPTKIIIGSQNGTVVVVPADGSWSEDGRMREVVDTNNEMPIVLDVGCLADGLAYTVISPVAQKQVQLWDLGKAVEIDSVDSDADGTPLYTFQAVASADGKRLLALSDLCLRVWSVKDHRLTLLGKQAIDNIGNHYSAGALPDGQFIYWDGARLWTLSADGTSKTRFAGTE